MSGVRQHGCADWHVLAEELAALMTAEPLSPFDTDRVIVESIGTGRLLAQALASRIGIEGGVCAGVSFASARDLRAELMASVGPTGFSDPWRSRALTFAIMERLPDLIRRPGCELLAHHVGPANDPQRPGRWLAAASRFSTLLLTYVRQELTMMRAWNRGEPVGPDGRELGPAERWQFELWRDLVAHSSVPNSVSRHDSLLSQLATSSSPLKGDRVHVIMPFALSEAEEEVLVALATTTEVHRWYVEPPSRLPCVQVHASHHPARQVEVLRDVLTGMFEADPTLEPRDVLVVCPDLDTFAPLINAAFRPGPGTHPGSALRVKMASAVQGTRNEVLILLGMLVALPQKRATIADLLEIAGAPPVAHRFGFTPDRLDDLERALVATNVRWGIDAAHRETFGVPVPQNTWLSGIDQLLAGLAMPEGGHWLGTVLPSDSVGSPQAALIGALSELVSRIRRFIHLTSQPMTIGSWVGVLREQLDLFASTTADDAWMLQRAWAQLAELADQAGDSDVLIGRAEFASVIASLLRTSGGRPNYATGALLVTRLGDLDGVPHKVICVLGTNEAASSEPEGDFLGDPAKLRRMRRDQWWRALTSASGQTVLVYGGFSEKTNEPLPMPVVVRGLLREASEQGAEVMPERAHPLHGFDPRNFVAERPFSFDESALAGARALVGVRHRPRIAAEVRAQIAALPSLVVTEFTVADLESWFESPAAFLLKRRADIRLTEPDERPTSLPLELSGLESWGLRDRLLRGLVEGLTPRTAEGVEWRRGTVGPQALGAAAMNAAASQAANISSAASRLLEQPIVQLDAQVCVGGISIAADLGLRNGVHGIITASKADSKVWARAWLTALVASAAGIDFRGVEVIGAPQKRSSYDLSVGMVQAEVARIRIRALPTGQAFGLLETIVEFVQRSLSSPLPLPWRSALKIAERQRRSRTPIDEAAAVGLLAWGYPGWDGDAATQVFFPTLPELLGERTTTGASQFLDGVTRLHLPMFAATETSDE